MSNPNQNQSRIRELVAVLSAANRAYYQENREVMSDREYDALYDELVRLEEETGVRLAGSPTQKVGYEVVSGLTKAAHDVPMLSLDKTKDAKALADFLGEREGLLSWKLDGLTVVLRYDGGELRQALTRGNGYIGEDITHNARVFRNVPVKVPYKGKFELRGEAVISIADFEAINEQEEQKYKNPRNLCSGAVRQLNSETAAKRRVLFFAFSMAGGEIPPPSSREGVEVAPPLSPPSGRGEKKSHQLAAGNFPAVGATLVVENPPTVGTLSAENSPTGGMPPAGEISPSPEGEGAAPPLSSPSGGGEKKSHQLAWLAAQGFEIAEYEIVTAGNVAEAVARFKEKIPGLAVMSDGLVLTYDDIAYSESLGATSKFPRDSIAFKWADEIAETTLQSVEWNTSRTGQINPVAIFAPVEIEGTQVSRASVHNVSILRSLDLHEGDKITVYKANMIIPQVAENLSANERGQGDWSPCGGIGGSAPKVLGIPAQCPVCRGETEIVGEPEVLYCTNSTCGAQKVRALSHFVSRDALNIAGLSAQTLEKLVVGGMVENFLDLFELGRFEGEIKQMEGFGQKSYDNLILSIEAAKDIALPNFVYALGIRHVGLAGAKLLSEFFSHDASAIADACRGEDFLETLGEVKGFGEAISRSLHGYFSREENFAMYMAALGILRLKAAPEGSEKPLAGLTFVITGDVRQFKNRKELQAHIENAGGRVTGSVTAKTSFLINNDAGSGSSKNKKAAALGVRVITEDEFLGMGNITLSS